MSAPSKKRTAARKPFARPEDIVSDAACRCTHELGDHRATRLRQCTVAGCVCERFRVATQRAQAEEVS